MIYRLKNIVFCFWVLLLSIYVPGHAQQAPDGLIIPPFKQAPERTPAFPLKDSRSLYSDSDVVLAKSNVEKYPSAKKIMQDIVKQADYWLGFTEKEILEAMPDARVPRGFDLCAKGCPVHGDSVFKVGGFYPWIIDPKRPFKVKCPIGGEIYPANDYAEHYHNGLEDKVEGRYADNGWGWVSPEGDRYWFVAHANQWTWMNHTIPGLLALSRAYLLTGDTRYAERAGFMLYRLAQVYPSMDHENQSRYGLMEKMKGGRYSGKILNKIWETQLIRNVAEAYDHVWNYIDKAASLQRYSGKTGKEIRAFIEANVLEDGLDGIADGRIAGNFGMHQNAMLHLQLVRQHAGKDEAIEKMTEQPSKSMAHNGMQYALYNQVFRDGMPLESPGYNAHWLKEIVDIADVLKKGNKNLFDNPRMKRLLDAPLDLVTLGRYTPDWGDGGSAIGGLTARYPDTYQTGYNQYKDKRYLYWINKSGDDSFSTFGSLFSDALPAVPPLAEERAVEPQQSRLFAGYGLGILNNASDKTALAFTYGMHYSHYHWDFLNVELFANGRKMMPDLGYPDAMNAYVAPVYTWSQNTISHNTVVVDQKKQNRNLPGKLHGFYSGSFARAIDASSPAYSEASRYRRNLVMVDVDKDQSYVVDFFHVSGGKQHDYSLHGPPGTVITVDDQWTAPAQGTLAGESVALETLYDDGKLRNEGTKTGYSRYGGSGFQHLFNVQKRKSGSGLIEYHHTDDASSRLRLHTLTPELSDLFIADAYDKPRARSYLLKYLIARRTANTNTPLTSTFISVMEPFRAGDAKIENASAQKLTEGPGHCVVVNRGPETDVIIYDTTSSLKQLKLFKIATDAVTSVVTFDKAGKPLRVFFAGGSFLSVGKKAFKAAGLQGTVEHTDPENGIIIVKLEKGYKGLPAGAEDRVAHFQNSYKATVHPIRTAELKNDRLVISVKDDLLVGKLRLDKYENGSLQTETSLSFQKQYNGTSLLNDKFEPVGKVVQLNNGKIEMTAPPALPLTRNQVLWLSNVGIGDEFRIEPVFNMIIK